MRPHLQRVLGRRGFTLAYLALLLAVRAWLIAAAGRAPFVRLWDWVPWQQPVPLVVMLPVCVNVSLASWPNQFSFDENRNETFDAARPGVVCLHRHPLLLALALWAAAHVVLNGELAHAILFGPSSLLRLWAQA
jgi:uncharacterized membrane protein